MTDVTLKDLSATLRNEVFELQKMLASTAVAVSRVVAGA